MLIISQDLFDCFAREKLRDIAKTAAEIAYSLDPRGDTFKLYEVFYGYMSAAYDTHGVRSSRHLIGYAFLADLMGADFFQEGKQPEIWRYAGDGPEAKIEALMAGVLWVGA